MSRFNSLVAKLAPPPIPSVQAWARAYDGRHGSLIDLSQAAPGYPPPPDFLAKLGEAAASPSTATYGRIEGEPALRAALAAHQSELYDASLAPETIHITAGCNQAFVCAALALAEPGSRVLLSNPYYFNHDTSLSMLGIRTGLVDCPAETAFLPSPDAVRAAIAGDVRALAIVSPNNPTGAGYPPELLDAIFDVCRAHGVWLIIDETYRDFLPAEKRRPHGLFSRPDWGDTLISLYSFSKCFCIPGHRVGAVTAHPAVVAEVAKVMDNLQICAPRVGQVALAAALATMVDWREANRREINARARRLREVMANAPAWRLAAVGAYFAFVRHPLRGTPSAVVAERLAKESGVVAVPGGYFGPGQEDFLRFAFANADVATIGRLAERLTALAAE